MARFGDLDTQYFDASGDPLASGKIYFYESGTTTPKTTFADINSSIPNTNPVILDAAGRQPNIFFEGVAKAVLTNNGDTQIVARDPVGETATNFGDEWVSTRIYGSNDVVIASDGQYYRSLLAGNQNNNPVTTAGFWTLLYSVEWNSGISYAVGSTVTYDLIQYQSLQSTNLNHQPDTSPTFWVSLEFAWLSTATYVEDQNVVGTDGILYTSLQNANTGNDPATSPAYWVGTSAAAAASAVAAATSEANAATSEANASTSATNASNSATASASSASASASSASSASTAQAAAETAQTAAETAQTASETAQAGAETAQTSAETAQAGAETAETNSANSATSSATSASAASASASAASASEGAAATSAANALTSENNSSASEGAAATSEANASSSASSASSSAAAASASQSASATSASSAATSATSAEAALDEFTDIYLGAFASDPTTDNDGDPLATGMLYYNTGSNLMRIYSGSAWQNVADTATTITLSQVTDVTASAAEVNILDGVTATTAELNYLDITSLGTTEASKAVTADAGGNVTFANDITVTGNFTSTGIDDNATAEKLQIEDAKTTISSTDVNISGDLQVGSSDAQQDAQCALQVVGATGLPTMVDTINSSGDDVIVYADGPLGISIISNATGSSSIFLGNVNDTDVCRIFYNHSTDDFALVSGGANALIVDSSQNVSLPNGNLGIGGTPAAPLDVRGNINGSHTLQVYNANTGAAAFSILDLNSGTRYSRWAVNYSGQYLAESGTDIITKYVDFDTQVHRNNAGTEIARLNSSGLSFDVGTNYLDTYEEGTFSPVLQFGGLTTGITYTTQSGAYTRIGDIVTVALIITLSSKGSATGAATITGMPFTCKNATVVYPGSLFISQLAFADFPQVIMRPNLSFIDLFEATNAGVAATTGITNADFSATTTVEVQLTYKAA